MLNKKTALIMVGFVLFVVMASSHGSEKEKGRASDQEQSKQPSPDPKPTPCAAGPTGDACREKTKEYYRQRSRSLAPGAVPGGKGIALPKEDPDGGETPKQ